MRTIDADELKKCAIPCEIHNGSLTELCVPLYQIDNAPTVEPRIEYGTDGQPYKLFMSGGQVVPDTLQGWRYEERPTGHWEKTGPNMYHCSHCGGVDSIGFANFCWLCGADMRGIVTGREEINTEQLNGKKEKTLTEVFMEDVNTDEVDYNELCYQTGHHLTMCDCELCDHRHECSGYEGGTE